MIWFLLLLVALVIMFGFFRAIGVMLLAGVSMIGLLTFIVASYS